MPENGAPTRTRTADPLITNLAGNTENAGDFCKPSPKQATNNQGDSHSGANRDGPPETERAAPAVTGSGSSDEEAIFKTSYSGMSPLGKAALAYANAGIAVFPCRPNGKAPLGGHGFKDATTDVAIVAEWWKRTPQANIGLACAPGSGLLALDVDRKDDVDGLANLQAAGFDPLTASPVLARTPSGGFHIMFRHDGERGNANSNLPAGNDVRGKGYVVASPSVIDGQRYAWITADGEDLPPDHIPDLDQLPAWPTALAQMEPPRRKRRRTGRASPYCVIAGTPHEDWADAAFRGEMDTLLATPKGGRNEALNRAAFALGTMVGGGHLRESVVRAELEEAHGALGCDRSDLKAIDNGLRDGMEKPREYIPPEGPTPNVGQIAPGLAARALSDAGAGLNVSGGGRALRLAYSAGERIQERPKAKAEPEEGDGWTLAPVMALDIDAMQPDEFLYGKYYIIGKASATIAPGGAGKSSLSLIEAVCIASGRDLLQRGWDGMKGERVLYFNLEESQDELNKRLLAILQHHGLTVADLGGRLFLRSGLSHPMRVADEGKRGAALTDHAAKLDEMVGAYGIRALIVDPLVSAHAVDESNNSAVDMVMKEFSRIADKWKCAVSVVHHTPKLRNERATSESGRGGIALRDAVRCLRVLNPIPAAKAEEWALDEDARRSVWEVSFEKANIGRTGLDLTYRIVGHIVKPGIERGVVTRFDATEAERQARERADNRARGAMDRAAQDACLQEMAEGEWSVSDKARGQWAGRLVAKHGGLDPKEDKQTIIAILANWKMQRRIISRDVQKRGKKAGDMKSVYVVLNATGEASDERF